MRKTIVKIALLLIVLVGGYLALFQRDKVKELFGKAKKEITGYKDAKTPDEAMEYFNKALENRNYEAAADYVSGDYGVQLRKVADKATKLAEAVDNFRSAAETHSIKSSKVDALLFALEPFPRRLKVLEVKETKKGEEAIAAVTVEVGTKQWAVGNRTIGLKQENGKWRLVLLFTPQDRNLFDDIDRNGPSFVKALDVVKTRMKTDATTKNDVAADLQEEINKAREP